MIKDRDDFYDALWNDYVSFGEKERENSFVYRYLKKKKDSRAEVIGRRKADLFEYAEQKKRDKYILLKSACFALERYRIISKQEYADILKDLIGTKDKTTGEVKIPAKYEALDDDEAFKKAEEMFERRFLMGCVRDFFYNLGYRTNKNDKHGQSVKLPNKHLKEDGYNDEFEMLYEYSLYSGNSENSEAVTDPAQINGEYTEKCTRLYDSLLREKCADAFVPLYIDPNTGAGVYIIGKNRFSEDEKAPDEVCFVCVILFAMVDAVSRLDDCSDYDISLSMTVKKRFRSVGKAFDYLSARITGKDVYENYPDENSGELPDGIDECFNLYFLSKEENEDMYRRNIGRIFREKQSDALKEVERMESLRRKSGK